MKYIQFVGIGARTFQLFPNRKLFKLDQRQISELNKGWQIVRQTYSAQRNAQYSYKQMYENAVQLNNLRADHIWGSTQMVSSSIGHEKMGGHTERKCLQEENTIGETKQVEESYSKAAINRRSKAATKTVKTTPNCMKTMLNR